MGDSCLTVLNAQYPTLHQETRSEMLSCPPTWVPTDSLQVAQRALQPLHGGPHVGEALWQRLSWISITIAIGR